MRLSTPLNTIAITSRRSSPLELVSVRRWATFVDSARFAGTCYRAANWQCVGQTQGSAKRGHLYHHHGNVKRIYLYPLTRHWREPLTAGLMP